MESFTSNVCRIPQQFVMVDEAFRLHTSSPLLTTQSQTIARGSAVGQQIRLFNSQMLRKFMALVPKRRVVLHQGYRPVTIHDRNKHELKPVEQW
ncbi:hypothetical protein PR048_020736 [Dryococelus australis]|uniref:Uncharacterized protein n=1 Tax=Dryococelus australis TaxID=614101 RepID=A0ABQ9H736_9NEOP|nr:hypothetical protein PR048_020736 [Dryococelus australis]